MHIILIRITTHWYIMIRNFILKHKIWYKTRDKLLMLKEHKCHQTDQKCKMTSEESLKYIVKEVSIKIKRILLDLFLKILLSKKIKLLSLEVKVEIELKILWWHVWLNQILNNFIIMNYYIQGKKLYNHLELIIDKQSRCLKTL